MPNLELLAENIDSVVWRTGGCLCGHLLGNVK